MMKYNQGDIIKVNGYKNLLFAVVSKNAFIRATGMFHVCPVLPNVPAGPIHLPICGKKGEKGTVLCEQIKVIDPNVRSCSRVDLLAYDDIMNISDTLQGIFEYD
jgi:mRNA-degrading endonuclease toxin of MazEF toxin-antitoxin module